MSQLKEYKCPNCEKIELRSKKNTKKYCKECNKKISIIWQTRNIKDTSKPIKIIWNNKRLTVNKEMLQNA